MRHVIVVVGSKAQDALPIPEFALTDDEAVRMSIWYANIRQSREVRLLDDEPSLLRRILLLPVLAYQFYVLVHNTKLWGGKRPLLFLRGRGLTLEHHLRVGVVGVFHGFQHDERLQAVRVNGQIGALGGLAG